MPKNFYITGLPRSRTAWLSVFLTHGNAFCHHEAMNGCHSIEDYQAKMSLSGYDFVGNSDCGLFLSPELINGPLIIIERDIDEVLHSLVKLFPGYDLRSYISGIRDQIQQLNGLRIPYNQLNDRLDEIWKYCIGEGYDRFYAENLKKMNIQTNKIQGDSMSFEVFSCRG